MANYKERRFSKTFGIHHLGSVVPTSYQDTISRTAENELAGRGLAFPLSEYKKS